MTLITLTSSTRHGTQTLHTSSLTGRLLSDQVRPEDGAAPGVHLAVRPERCEPEGSRGHEQRLRVSRRRPPRRRRRQTLVAPPTERARRASVRRQRLLPQRRAATDGQRRATHAALRGRPRHVTPRRVTPGHVTPDHVTGGYRFVRLCEWRVCVYVCVSLSTNLLVQNVLLFNFHTAV